MREKFSSCSISVLTCKVWDFFFFWIKTFNKKCISPPGWTLNESYLILHADTYWTGFILVKKHNILKCLRDESLSLADMLWYIRWSQNLLWTRTKTLPGHNNSIVKLRPCPESLGTITSRGDDAQEYTKCDMPEIEESSMYNRG